LDRLADIVATDCDPHEKLVSSKTDADLGPLQIELRNVSFRYSAASPWLLKDVSYVFEPGKRYCISGRSGAGKSTLFKLLLGILTPTEGELYCNGVPLGEFGMARFRRGTGVVLQSDKLYAGSVLENVAYFAEEIDIERVGKVLNLARVQEDVNAMPMQLHTLCEEDTGIFSGGQAQRLLLARALYPNPRLLLMDEATSNLDVKTEADVVRNLVQLPCTQIFIAHRPEAINSATHVLVLHEGALEENMRGE
jgi:ATP-binding cassette, subfamily B, bacterial CvaB/MchF/RaxB